MPYINFKTNANLSETQIASIESKAGKLISKLSGKDESQLMVSLDNATHMMFRGEDVPCMMIHMDVFGDPDKAELDDFFSSLCEFITLTTEIETNNIYMNVSPFYSWGAGGRYN